MDIVLEVFDTFLFDRLYAAALPASSSSYVSQYVKGVATSTFSSMREMGTHTPTQKYIYEPASRIISFKPSKWAYASILPRDNLYRQAFSLFLIVWLFGLVVYFICSTLSYVFVFDKNTFKHPKYLKNQIRMEMKQTMIAMPVMSLLTIPAFVGVGTWPCETIRFTVQKHRFYLYKLPPIPHLHPIHRLLHLLDPPRPTPPSPLQKTPQTPPQMDHANPIRITRIPSTRRLRPIRPLPRLPLHPPPPKTRLRRPLRLHQHLDHPNPRRRIRCRLPNPQRSCMPHNAPPLLQLQLRPIHDPVGPTRRQLP